MIASLFARNVADCAPGSGLVVPDPPLGGYNATDKAAAGHPCLGAPTDLFGLPTADVATFLADNGGPTRTIALGNASAAADLVAPTQLCTIGGVSSLDDYGTDQRGLFRPLTDCAAGAFQPDALSTRPGAPTGGQPAPGSPTSTPPNATGGRGEPCGALTTRTNC